MKLPIRRAAMALSSAVLAALTGLIAKPVQAQTLDFKQSTTLEYFQMRGWVHAFHRTTEDGRKYYVESDNHSLCFRLENSGSGYTYIVHSTIVLVHKHEVYCIAGKQARASPLIVV